jgi:single-strand DNA-binding protein
LPGRFNEVRLVGKVSAAPEELVLPSCDVLVKLRVVVRRPPGGVSTQVVDALDCAAFSSRARRAVGRWRRGDVVEVEGAVRRRFFRVAGIPASRFEIEVTKGRVVRRAPAA